MLANSVLKAYYITRILFFTFILFLSGNQFYAQQQSVDTTLLLMGTRFELCAIAENKTVSRSSLLAGINEIRRIEKIISSHQETSETFLVNQNAGIKPVQVSDELFNLINRSLKISKITDRAFDISFGAIYKVYQFDGSQLSLPPTDSISKYQDLIGFQQIVLDNQKHTVYLQKRGMKIGFGAIGKGYAANMAKKIMYNNGAKSGYVNASGDILFWGYNEKNEKWKVAIQSPYNKEEVIGNLEVHDMAVVTSGNYEKNFQINGITYSHIIDPKTGYPVTETISTTIICPDAELADALATASSVLGSKNGIKLINQLKGVECLIVNQAGEIFYSNGLDINLLK